MQTSMRTVAEHLIFPHQQFARKGKRGKTLLLNLRQSVLSLGRRRENSCKTTSVTNEHMDKFMGAQRS